MSAKTHAVRVGVGFGKPSRRDGACGRECATGKEPSRCSVPCGGRSFFFHDMPPSRDLPDAPPGTPRDERLRARDRGPIEGRASHLDAPQVAASLSSTSPAPRKEIRRRNRRHDSTLSPRNRAVLLALARCRILSFDQLRRAVFPGLSPQRVGQLLHALAAQGWLQIWEDVSRIGGRPRYALPTRRALALGIGVLRAESMGQASDGLASLMLRGRSRRPLVLVPRVTPAFLAHQRECNDLLLAYARIPGVRLLWSTSFDRPFPLQAHGVSLPQPDYVLLLERAGASALIFGEHDRGHESLAHFRRTKVDRYAALAARPELTMEFFGFSRFMVWVTVLDARVGAPLRRLQTLARIARDAAASDVLAFTLAGWAVVSPDAPIWFCDGAAPEAGAVAEAKSHPLLRSVPTHPLRSTDGIAPPNDMRTPCVCPSPGCGPGDSAVVH